MNHIDIYREAKRKGRANQLMRNFAQGIMKNKTSEEAMREAAEKLDGAQPRFSPAAKAMYQIQYRRAIEKRLTEDDARKEALHAALSVMERGS